MESVKEPRICVNFYSKVRNTVAETHSILRETHGDNVLSKTTIY
jgi:hypothetical protein